MSYSLAVANGLLPDWCSVNECFAVTLGNGTILTFRQRRGLNVHRAGNGHDAAFARSRQEILGEHTLTGIPVIS